MKRNINKPQMRETMFSLPYMMFFILWRCMINLFIRVYSTLNLTALLLHILLDQPDFILPDFLITQANFVHAMTQLDTRLTQLHSRLYPCTVIVRGYQEIRNHSSYISVYPESVAWPLSPLSNYQQVCLVSVAQPW